MRVCVNWGYQSNIQKHHFSKITAKTPTVYGFYPLRLLRLCYNVHVMNTLSRVVKINAESAVKRGKKDVVMTASCGSLPETKLPTPVIFQTLLSRERTQAKKLDKKFTVKSD